MPELSDELDISRKRIWQLPREAKRITLSRPLGIVHRMRCDVGSDEPPRSVQGIY